MRTSRLLVSLSALTVTCILAVTTAQMRVNELASAPANSPPVANPDSYTVHGSLVISPMANDTDPDGNPIIFDGLSSGPFLGTLAPVNSVCKSTGRGAHQPTHRAAAQLPSHPGRKDQPQDRTYTYDDVNRMTNLADSANLNFPHNYDAVNRLTSRSAPNGVTTNFAYDGLSRLTALTHVLAANTLVSNQYTHSDAHNITNWTNLAANHAYGYDLVDRLTSATNSSQPNENYSYDGIGNRTASHLSASYSYQPFNKLTSSATASYTYDNNGNMLARTDSLGARNFIWNEDNRLTQVTLSNGLIVAYKYDGLGRRIQRTTSGGASERYVYDGQDVILDLNADWSVATTYFNDLGIDNKLRQSSSATGVSYYLTEVDSLVRPLSICREWWTYSFTRNFEKAGRVRS